MSGGNDWRERLVPAVDGFIRAVDCETLGGEELYGNVTAVATRVAFLCAADRRGLSLDGSARGVEPESEWERLTRVFRDWHTTRGGRFFAPLSIRHDVVPDHVLRPVLDVIPQDPSIDEIGEVYASLLDYRIERVDGAPVLRRGSGRRGTGSHYTPRELAARIVARALEPVLACLGRDPRAPSGGPVRTADRLLELKICDPAMGAGVFLAESCRQLADEVVAAWTASGEIDRISDAHPDPSMYARRLVAQRCIYGVDKDRTAVDLARVALWLEVGDPSLPLTFVDHALRHGDSLVGLDLDQVRAFHWQPKDQLETCAALLDDALTQALEHRAEILDLAEREDPASQREKERLLSYADLAMERVRLVADVCVGAFFAQGKAKAREQERNQRLALVERYLAGDESVQRALEHMADVIRKEHAPFHWMLEFPEVFYQERPDPLQGGVVNGAAYMDVFVGNPPFAGKNSITRANGDDYVYWLMAMHPDVKGRPNTDLCAYFFRRAGEYLGSHGAMGLVATNTIAQGDSRLMALKTLVDGGASIYDATRDTPWPGAAAVTVAIVNLALGRPREFIGAFNLDGKRVPIIDSRLRPRPERAELVPLVSNANRSFMGGKLVGIGLAVGMEEYSTLVAKNPSNAEVLRPYIGGAEVNRSPDGSHERYMIDFSDMTLEQARRWPDLLQIAEEKVKPAREKDKRGTYKTYWWRPGESGSALYAALEGFERCLVAACVTKHLTFSFQPTTPFFSNTLYVFPLDTLTAFAVLQSRVHEPWTRLLSSSLKDQLRYAASDCFDTFPFPQPDPRTVIEPVEAAGQALYHARAQYMLDEQVGLTTTYNALTDPACHQPAIIALRALHQRMDAAVLAAYGWADIQVPPFCPAAPGERQALAAFEDEVIDRLYVLNAERAAEEARLGRSRRPTGRRPGSGPRNPSSRGR